MSSLDGWDPADNAAGMSVHAADDEARWWVPCRQQLRRLSKLADAGDEDARQRLDAAQQEANRGAFRHAYEIASGYHEERTATPTLRNVIRAATRG